MELSIEIEGDQAFIRLIVDGGCVSVGRRPIGSIREGVEAVIGSFGVDEFLAYDPSVRITVTRLAADVTVRSSDLFKGIESALKDAGVANADHR